jgi:DNA-binding response OmpR family regulator
MRALKSVSGRLKKLFRGSEAPVFKGVTPQLLIIDDEESICFSMSEYFSQHGFKVDTAHEMEEAEALIAKTDYEVIIQDLRLDLTRKAEGIEIIKLIHDRRPETRIIVLTSFGTAELEEMARCAGADAFLHKPKPLSHVAEVINGLMETPRRMARI